MRFNYLESMTDPSFYIPLVQAAEEAGWDGFAVPDSICYPEVSDSKYPYTADGSREFLDGKPFLEPFSIIPVLGAVTSRMRFRPMCSMTCAPMPNLLRTCCADSSPPASSASPPDSSSWVSVSLGGR